MCQTPPAIEQAGHRVRQERAAGHRPGDDLGQLHEVARHQIDQILREAPDRRWMPEQLVRVQVDAPVIAVAVVEMPVEHQDLRLLQVLQRLLAYLSASVHDSPNVGAALSGPPRSRA